MNKSLLKWAVPPTSSLLWFKQNSLFNRLLGVSIIASVRVNPGYIIDNDPSTKAWSCREDEFRNLHDRSAKKNRSWIGWIVFDLWTVYSERYGPISVGLSHVID